jgi:hypothetical protein
MVRRIFDKRYSRVPSQMAVIGITADWHSQRFTCSNIVRVLSPHENRLLTANVNIPTQWCRGIPASSGAGGCQSSLNLAARPRPAGSQPRRVERLLARDSVCVPDRSGRCSDGNRVYVGGCCERLALGLESTQDRAGGPGRSRVPTVLIGPWLVRDCSVPSFTMASRTMESLSGTGSPTQRIQSIKI